MLTGSGKKTPENIEKIIGQRLSYWVYGEDKSIVIAKAKSGRQFFIKWV